MESSQIHAMSEASVDDVKFLMDLKSKMSDGDFYNLTFETLYQFIENEEIVRKLLEVATHTWEISVILEMESESWFSETLLYLSKSFRALMLKDKAKAVLIINNIYPRIHESLACWHDAFFLQNHDESDNPRHIARACFRMLGDTIESVHAPHIEFIYKMLVNLESVQIHGRPESVSFGKEISNLIEIEIFEKIYKQHLFGVSFSQWRNIANHSSYRYDSKSKVIICNYGSNNSQTIKITIDELIQLMNKLNQLQALHKIAVDFFIVEFMHEVDFKSMTNVELSLETIIGQIGNNLGLNGYKILSTQHILGNLMFKLEDSNSNGSSGLREVFPMLHNYLAMLYEKGMSPVFELFDLKGNKLTEVYLERRVNG
jgi:hypothetical protein